MPLRVYQIYAFLAEDEHGDEGILAMPTPEGIMPLVAADSGLVETLRRAAAAVGAMRDREVTLARFEVRTDLEKIGPTDPDWRDSTP